jgi:hypothetical protein
VSLGRRYDELDDDALIVCAPWDQVSGFAQLEPSISVVQNGDPLDVGDRDQVKVGGIIRRHPWRKNGWLRLELLHKLVPSRRWTGADILKLITLFHPDLTSCAPHRAPPHCAAGCLT